jgi:hypothetical protein
MRMDIQHVAIKMDDDQADGSLLSTKKQQQEIMRL